MDQDTKFHMNNKFNIFEDAVTFWKDEPDVHREIFTEFFNLVNQDEELKSHRDFVETYQYGYGDRPFHWMWNLVVKSLPQDFKFLEIGVFQGQVISLVSLLNRRYGKDGQVFGLTPLDAVDDAFSKHPKIDYEKRIMTLYSQFGLDAGDLTIIQGLSTDENAVKIASDEQPYDCVYIDGGHDYETVVSDITTFGEMVKPGGLLVMDDSANFLSIPDGLIRMNWKGLLDVSTAVKDYLETDVRFEHIFSCGHNRIWRRV